MDTFALCAGVCRWVSAVLSAAAADC